MTVLMLSLQVPSESELSAVTSKLIITPSGLPLLKSKIAPQKNQKNTYVPIYIILMYQSFRDKILLVRVLFYCYKRVLYR
jgi:hypothetical protein